jgi:hypothetical protein
MAVGHAENIIGLLHQFSRQHPAALFGNINSEVSQRAYRMGAGRLAIDCANTRRNHTVIVSSFDGMTEKAFSHGAAADVSGADKKDGLHSRVVLKVGRGAKIVNGEN